MVVEGSGKFIGLITANDVLQNFDSVEKVSEIYRTDIDYVAEDANVSQVLSIMAQKQVGYVPVISDDKRLTGLITRSSLVNVLGQHLTV